MSTPAPDPREQRAAERAELGRWLAGKITGTTPPAPADPPATPPTPVPAPSTPPAA